MEDTSIQAPSADSVYRSRVGALRVRERLLDQKHRQLGYVRLAFAIALVILLFPPIPPLFLPLIGFALAARVHERVVASLAETRRTLAFFEHALARLGNRWAGLQPRQTPLDFSGSLYAADLDLFGPASVFELLCEARTSIGERTLAFWLLHAAPVEEVLRRQEAVHDLRERLALRETFAAAPGPAHAQVDLDALERWVARDGPELPNAFRWAAPFIVLLTVAAAWRYAVANRPLLLTLCLLLEVSLTFHYRHVFRELLREAEDASRALRTCGVLLHALEAETFHSQLLQNLQGAFRNVERSSASQAISQLARWITWAEARSNYVVRLLDAPLLYSLQCASGLQRWKKRFGRTLLIWLEGLGECEALLSLAAFHYEHPDDIFPVLEEVPAAFQARGLGHVLLPEAHCVRNDVALDYETQLLLVSGSNMSGKSTLLRAVGVNAVLAFAGAPVRARSLTLSPLHVAASIQVNDSLQGGRSRFYSEILRLRAIVEAAETRGRVLFLIDEVLAGTNSNDRAAGSQGLVKKLLEQQAIGLLSTHDLALTETVGDQRAVVRNVHFEDDLVDGQLHFSYELKEGVVQRSNGLALMRMIGLDV